MFLDILGFWLFFYFYFFFDHITFLLLLFTFFFSSEIQRTPRRTLYHLFALTGSLQGVEGPSLLLAFSLASFNPPRVILLLLSFSYQCLVTIAPGTEYPWEHLFCLFFLVIYDQPQADGRGQGRLISHGISAKRKGFGFWFWVTISFHDHASLA